MDKDMQKIDEKIDKLASAMERGFGAVEKRFDGVDKQIGGLGQRLDAVEETLMFMKNRVATKEDLEKFATKEDLDGKFKMLEGHMNVIEQKLDDHTENLKDIPARVTALEVKALAK